MQHPRNDPRLLCHVPIHHDAGSDPGQVHICILALLLSSELNATDRCPPGAHLYSVHSTRTPPSDRDYGLFHLRTNDKDVHSVLRVFLWLFLERRCQHRDRHRVWHPPSPPPLRHPVLQDQGHQETLLPARHREHRHGDVLGNADHRRSWL